MQNKTTNSQPSYDGQLNWLIILLIKNSNENQVGNKQKQIRKKIHLTFNEQKKNQIDFKINKVHLIYLGINLKYDNINVHA